ncbi:MAG: arsenite methyltransferase [Bacteroidetes bacterium]|nr:arsenite methyltransferase [Bacteroidota bacterium]
MQNSDELKALVREKYSEIALQDKSTNASSCCGATTSCGDPVYSIMSDQYDALKGYQPEADLGLGCGLPTEFAKIRPGDVVIDLGSGAGNDCFVARHETGATGKVIGIDFTPAMIERARANAEKLGFHNVEFRQGDIEKMPVTAGIADVVVSNCVLNLVPDKAAVFAEINRVLKPGGHFSISDIVLEGHLTNSVRKTAELYAGCISGAIQKSEYLGLIEKAGFTNITVQKQKTIEVPEEILSSYLSAEEINAFRESGTGIYSITVFGVKDSSCTPGSGCC